jgi:signal transduction histidine kinase
MGMLATLRTRLSSPWADVALGASVTAVYALELLRWDGDRFWPLIAVAGLGGAGLALRRVQPLVAFVLAMGSIWLVGWLEPGFDDDSAALVFTFFLALYSVGRHTGGAERWLGAGLVLLNAVVFVFSDVQSPDTGDVAFAAMFVGAPWLAGLALRIRHDREQTWRARDKALRADREESERRAVTAERARIARELHDVVSHAIAVTVLQARGARRMVGVDESAVRGALDAIDQTNTQALGDMRRLLALLRDTEDGPRDGPQPTLAQLPRMVQQVRDSGLRVDLRTAGAPDDVPPGIELSAYRIVQEALTNVIKHAGPGASAVVDLTYGDRALELSVCDDGTAPLHDGASTGHGLVGIRERVAVVGGEVAVHRGAEGGYSIQVRLPYAVET